MRAEWEPDELIEAWTLVKSDWDLIVNKAGVTRLGYPLPSHAACATKQRPAFCGHSRDWLLR